MATVRACAPAKIQHHVEHNQRLVKVSNKIPARIAQLVDRQGSKVADNARQHIAGIVADGRSIQSECRSVVAEYNILIEDVHANKYTDAVQAMNDIIANSEHIIATAQDAEQQTLKLYDLAKTLMNPFAVLIATGLFIISQTSMT